MTQLSRQQAQLAPMMRFVSDEVIQKVYDVRRKVLPGGWWNRSTARYRQLDQVNHPTATAW